MSSLASVPNSEWKPLRNSLLDWYQQYRRDLPWRRTRDPYAIWVSEIMLQQTRVAVVVDRYEQFMKRFPTVKALSSAKLDDVLAVWSGLGYYRRARALHQAAQMVVHHLHGAFPTTAAGWRQLPGVGRYTSAAIASIAFNEPIAVVDGNVERVVERLVGEPSQGDDAWSRAAELLQPRAPGDWNQAMMELGATVCLPKQPQCLICPVRAFCQTRGETTRPPQKMRKRAELCYGLFIQNETVLLVQRPADHSLMAGMWELPEAKRAPGELQKLRHSITDTDYTVFVVPGKGHQPVGKWVSYEEAQQMALTGLTRKILRLHFAPEL